MITALLAYLITFVVVILLDKEKKLSLSELHQFTFTLFIFASYWIALLIEYIVKSLF